MIMIRTVLLYISVIVIIASGEGSDSLSSAGQGCTVAKNTEMTFDTMSGVLPKMIKNHGKPYLVVSDIEVPADQTVTIEPGVVLMFRDFTGLHVQGKLIALGTRKAPIVFTSEFDTSYNRSDDNVPNPFDWNGVYIHSGGIGTSIEYCKVFYSVYGIKTDTKYIRISPAQFRDNGKSDFILEGKSISTGKQPYSYVLDMKDAVKDGVPVTILRDPAAPRRNTIRYIGLSAVLAGAAGSVYFGLQTKDVQDKLELLSRDVDENTASHSSTEWNSKHNRRNRLLSYTISFGTAALLGLTGFVWTFTF